MSKRPCPSPQGCKGNFDHQATVQLLRKRAQAEFPGGGPYRIHENTSIKNMPGQVNRRPDIWVENTQTGRVEKVYEAARMNQDGQTPVSREQKKMREYRAAGIPVHMEPVK